MTGLGNLIKRNCKLFFKDKGMFLTSLITPLILLVLYVTFLGNVYRDTYSSAMPQIEEKLINSLAASQLVSSLLAVSCVTVAFCSNLLMVQDKVSGAIKDIKMTTVSRSTIALAYFIASAFSTLIICFSALAVCFLYVGSVGWYFSLADVLLICLDVVLLVLFGTALSSIINFPLSTSGQGSAVGTIVSSGYGFICGAYMPISQFGDGLQRVISCLPGTYGTSLIRNHCMRGVIAEIEALGVPSETMVMLKDTIDCNLYFFGNKVEIPVMFAVLLASVLVFMGIYILMNIKKRNFLVQKASVKK